MVSLLCYYLRCYPSEVMINITLCATGYNYSAPYVYISLRYNINDPEKYLQDMYVVTVCMC